MTAPFESDLSFDDLLQAGLGVPIWREQKSGSEPVEPEREEDKQLDN